MSTVTQPFELMQAQRSMTCRACGEHVDRTFVDLGMSPLCESFVAAADLKAGEMYYPLHVFVCGKCFLVQLEEFESREKIFSDYAYFSSYSDSWLKHSETYCEDMIRKLGLTSESFVVEAASNDGYLLQYFAAKGVPVLGIEPAANVAAVAVAKGVPSLVEFLGKKVAQEVVGSGRRADLVLGNNVLAQVPDLNDFVGGLATLLKPEGVLTLEFPHLLRLIERNEFDTIYHEHFSYFSLLTAQTILAMHGLRVYDVDELPTHGGSLRLYASLEGAAREVSSSVGRVIADERAAQLDSMSGYAGFARQVKETKLAFTGFLLQAARDGKSVAGYGAPGKSATLLHYCGIGKDLIEYTVDRNPHKQGRYLPGSRIPILHPDTILQTKPDYVVILPWNLKEEIATQLKFIRDWGGRFIVPIPNLEIF